MDEDQSKCVLRTQALCDGDRAASSRSAPGQDEGCYCKWLRYATSMGLDELASEQRTARARTVARAAELHRTTRRWESLINIPERRW